MSSVPVESLGNRPKLVHLLWSSCIGFNIAMGVTFILFWHLLYSYRKMVKSQERTSTGNHEINKKPYILGLIYFVLAFFTSTSYSSIMTNSMTSEIRDFEFSHLRCTLGWLFWGIFVAVDNLTLSFIFLYRVYVAYKDTTFEYSAKTYKFFIFCILINATLYFIVPAIPFWTGEVGYTVWYDPASHYAFCGTTRGSADNMYYFIFAIVFGVFQTGTSFGLLALFIRPLMVMTEEQIRQYIKEHKYEFKFSLPPRKYPAMHEQVESDTFTTDTMDKPVETSTECAASPSPRSQSPFPSAFPSPSPGPLTPEEFGVSSPVSSPAPVSIFVPRETGQTETIQRQPTVSNVMKSVDVNQVNAEIERILEIHNLMKKQIIFVFIAICSTFAIIIGSFVFHASFMFQFGWDIIINSICVWMMLKTSKKYWNLCRRWGFCCCCYTDSNRLGV